MLNTKKCSLKIGDIVKFRPEFINYKKEGYTKKSILENEKMIGKVVDIDTLALNDCITIKWTNDQNHYQCFYVTKIDDHKVSYIHLFKKVNKHKNLYEKRLANYIKKRDFDFFRLGRYIDIKEKFDGYYNNIIINFSDGNIKIQQSRKYIDIYLNDEKGFEEKIY